MSRGQRKQVEDDFENLNVGTDPVSQPDLVSKPYRRTIQIALGLAGVIAASIALSFGLGIRSLKHQEALAERDGLPLSPGELRTNIRVSPDRNAAQSLIAAGEMWERNRSMRVEADSATVDADASSILSGNVYRYGPSKPGQRFGPVLVNPELAKLKRLIDSKRAALDAFRRASTYSELAFGRRYEDWPFLDFHEMNTVCNGIAALEVEGAFAYADDDLNRFEADWLAAARLIALMRHDASDGFGSGRAGILIPSYLNCEMVLFGPKLSRRILGILHRFLDIVGPPTNVADGMRFGGLGIWADVKISERLKAGEQRYLDRWPPEENDQFAVLTTPVVGLFARASLIENLRVQHRIALRCADDLIEMRHQLTQYHQNVRKTIWPYRPLEALLTFQESAPKVVGQLLASYRILEQSVGVLEFRERNGTLPLELPLSGSSSVDPFGGKNLRYEAKAGVFTIWSVGPDGLDNHSKSQPGDDIVSGAWFRNHSDVSFDPAVPKLGFHLVTRSDGTIGLEGRK